ncbi:MAG: hypothetical protein Q4C30_03695 [Bacteroidia bacterium]|nr:hypothetical protein [Bacteroidia bacterium]
MVVLYLTTSCQLSDRMAIVGDYYTEYKDEHVEFSDMECSVELRTKEEFRLWSVTNITHMLLTFHFVEPFVFPSMTLEYEVEAEGEWQIDGDTLSISLAQELSNIEYKYLCSNATTPTQESMVRNIKGMLLKDFEEAKSNPEKSAFILRHCNSKARIISNTDREMTIAPLSAPNTLIVKRKE